MMTQMLNNSFHSETAEKVLKILSSGIEGLSHKEAKALLQDFGLNELREKKAKHPALIFLKQFHSVLIYILIAAAAISFFIGHVADVYVILAVILVNAIIGFIQENKAEKSIQALKRMIVPYAKVFRGGKLQQVHAKELVPGDIIFLEEGDRIPADARLLEVKNTRTVEASLTGESLPIDKDVKALPEKTGLADRKNMVWMGTFLAGGQAKAVVVSTGIKTAIGEVATSIEKIKKVKGHFEKKTDILARQMGIIAVACACIVFLIGFFIRRFEFSEVFLFTIASLVAGIPEGLPAVLVIVLAIGAHRMAKRNAIIRTLPATETLGVATVIATDKTGTLTQNTMNVEKIFLPGEDIITVSGEGWRPSGDFSQKDNSVTPLENPRLSKLLHIACVCNNARIEKEEDKKYKIIGDPTEAALVVLAEKAGVKKEELLEKEKRIDDLPFNPDLKYRASLSVLVEESCKKEIYVIGAPEAVLSHSSFMLGDKG
ncbi:MAG: HAD-IC family P-type ATPase [Candidatus Omnitrophota bacterium]